MSADPAAILPSLQIRLFRHYGPLHWWPAETPFEVAVGAILTQNTAWTNVEFAIDNLRESGRLFPAGIAETPLKELEELIRPSGFYRQKALRLQGFAQHLVHHWQGDIGKLCDGPLDKARARLLALSGIGPETADSILLYAANRTSFVIDAYTRRIFQRIGLLHGHETYDELRSLFMLALPEDKDIYNEFHAQIVNLAKDYCKKRQPRCGNCPLKRDCLHASGWRQSDIGKCRVCLK